MADVFVAMSFSQKFLPVWHKIEKAVKKTSANPIRVDNLPDVEDINETIFRKIRESDILLAECTITPETVNSMLNVVMEIQCAREWNKPVIIVTQSNPSELPFDLRTKNIIMYKDDKDGLDLLEYRIIDKLNSALIFTKDNVNQLQNNENTKKLIMTIKKLKLALQNHIESSKIIQETLNDDELFETDWKEIDDLLEEAGY